DVDAGETWTVCAPLPAFGGGGELAGSTTTLVESALSPASARTSDVPLANAVTEPPAVTVKAAGFELNQLMAGAVDAASAPADGLDIVMFAVSWRVSPTRSVSEAGLMEMKRISEFGALDVSQPAARTAASP